MNNLNRNNMELTAVEWLLDNLITEPYSELDFKHNKECWDKAKEMEKQRVIDFGYDIADNLACGVYGDKKDVEELYNEFFKEE